MKKVNRGKFDDTMAAMFSNREYSTDYLFYAHIVGKCSVHIDYKLPAPAGVNFMYDHFNLFINPTMFDEYELVGRLAIIKHEMLHIILGHIKRTEEREALKWNFSTDCALNQLINSKHLPAEAVLPENFSKMFKVNAKKNESAEYYYELIIDEESEKQSGGSGEESDESDNNERSGGSGDQSDESDNNDQSGQSGDQSSQPMDTHDIWGESKGDETLQKDITSNMIKTARDSAAKNMGNIPNECDEWLKLHNTKAQVNWRKTLRSITGNKKVGSRSTINRRNRRFQHREDLRGKTKNRT